MGTKSPPWGLVSLCRSLPFCWRDQISAAPRLWMLAAPSRYRPSGLGMPSSSFVPFAPPIRLRVERSHVSQSCVWMSLVLNARMAGFCGDAVAPANGRRVGTTMLNVGGIFAGLGKGSGAAVQPGFACAYARLETIRMIATVIERSLVLVISYPSIERL